MRVLLVALLVLMLVLLAGVALATTSTARAPTDLALIRGSPPVAMTIVATSIQANAPTKTADYLAGSITPTARTGPMALVITPCARDRGTNLVGFIRDTYNDKPHAYPAAQLTTDNPGTRRLDRTLVDHYYNMPAAFV